MTAAARLLDAIVRARIPAGVDVDYLVDDHDGLKYRRARC